MKSYLNVLIIFLLLFFLKEVNAQNLPVLFGDIDRADIEMKEYEPDKGADAVILSEYGIAEIVFANGIQLVYNYNVRIKILNSNGFDYANVQIPYSRNDVLTKLQAATYNIENNKIVVTKLEKKEFYVDKVTSGIRVMRFALPKIRAGSVIEYKYQLRSGSLFNLVPWQFQKSIPVRYSYFTSLIPSYFNYKEEITGDFSKVKITMDFKQELFGGYSTTIFIKNYICTDVPAYKEEPYSSGSDDYVTQLNYELGGINFPGHSYHEVTPTYASLSNKLLEREDFGKALLKTGFLNNLTASVTRGVKKDMDKVNIIHQYITEHMVWNGVDDYTLSTSLKKSFKQERGNAADINLLYLAMLRQAGLRAEPVVLSTRSHGLLNESYAVMQKLNYILVLVKIDDTEYLTDATDPLRPPGLLPFEYLNQQGRLISLKSSWVDLKNMEKTSTITNLNLKLDSTGTLTGNYTAQYRGYDAYNIRKYIKLEGTHGYTDDIKYFLADWNILDHQIENIDSINMPILEKMNLASSSETQQVDSGIVINPFFMMLIDENPFYFYDERKAPIDFGYPQEKIDIINILIPDNYAIEEFPDNISLVLADNGGRFLFGYTKLGNNLSVQCRISVSKTVFKPDEYEILRELYSRIMEKQAELIVLRKKI